MAGLEHYDQLVSSLEKPGFDTGPMLQLIQDAALFGAEEGDE